MSTGQDAETETEIGVDALEEYETREQSIAEESSPIQSENPSGFVGPFGKKRRVVRDVQTSGEDTCELIENVQSNSPQQQQLPDSSPMVRVAPTPRPPPSTSSSLPEKESSTQIEEVGSSPPKSRRMELIPPPSNEPLDLCVAHEDSRKEIWDKTGVPIIFSCDDHKQQQRPSIICFHSSSSSSTSQEISDESGGSVVEEESLSTVRNGSSKSTHRPRPPRTYPELTSSILVGNHVLKRVGSSSARGSRRSSSTIQSSGGRDVSSSGSERGVDGKSQKSKKRYVCPDCNKEFSQLRNFRYHRSRHEGTTQFACTCPICGKSFNDKGYLSSHLKIHRNAKEYKCEYCDKCFNQRVAYNMHIRIHTGLKPHQCHLCTKAFSRKMLLRQHIRTHTGERPYKCGVCQKAFADRSNMLLHQRLHSGQRPYKCEVCGKSFSKNHHLKTHLNHHAGIRPYQCDKCKACFSQSSNMKTHYKKCNGTPTDSPPLTPNPGETSVTSTMSSTTTITSSTRTKMIVPEQPRFVQLPYTFGQNNFECQSTSVEMFHPVGGPGLALPLPIMTRRESVVAQPTPVLYPVHHQDIQMFPPTQNQNGKPQQPNININPRRSRIRTGAGGVIPSTIMSQIPGSQTSSKLISPHDLSVSIPIQKRKSPPSSVTDNYSESGVENPSTGTGARKSLKTTFEKSPSTTTTTTSSKGSQVTTKSTETKKRSSSTRISSESTGHSPTKGRSSSVERMSTVDLSRPHSSSLDTTTESPIPLNQYRPSVTSAGSNSSQQQSSSPVITNDPSMIPHSVQHYNSPPTSQHPQSLHHPQQSSSQFPVPTRHVHVSGQGQPGEQPHILYERIIPQAAQLSSVPVQQQQQQFLFHPPYSPYAHYYPQFPHQQQQRVDPVTYSQMVQPNQPAHGHQQTLRLNPQGQEGRAVSPQQIILHQLQQHNLLAQPRFSFQPQMQFGFPPQPTMTSQLLYQQQLLEQFQQLHGQRTTTAPLPLQRPQVLYFDQPQVPRGHHPPPQGREETLRISQQQQPRPVQYQEFPQGQPGQMREELRVSQHRSHPYPFDQGQVESQQQFRKEPILTAQQQ